MSSGWRWAINNTIIDLAKQMHSVLTNTANFILTHSKDMRCSLQTAELFSAHLLTQHHSQTFQTWPHPPEYKWNLHMPGFTEITTHHWLLWLGIAWVLLRWLWRSNGGRGVGGLGLAGRWAAVGHGQLTQVGGVWGENGGSLATVHTSFSWEGDRKR